MLIKVEDLKKEYSTLEVVTKVLHGLSFSIDKGEFVAIMGPSGSGKSTLMHILGFLDKLTSGHYEFEGKNVEKLDDDELAKMRNEKIGFVFQAFNLLPRTTVLENVKLPLTYSPQSRSQKSDIGYRRFPSWQDRGRGGARKRKSAEERAKEVLANVGLGHRLDHFTNQLSGGEQQRVAIARALVNNPAVIFADEPTGNLDSKSGIQIMQILQKLNEAGHTIILVTHETHIAEYADRVIRLRDGLIVDDYKVKNKI